MPLYLESDNNVGVTGVMDERTSAYLNAGTMTYSISSISTPSVVITSGSCTYVAASNGNYLGVVDATVMTTLNFSEGCLYYIKYVFVEGNYNRTWRLESVAQYGSDT